MTVTVDGEGTIRWVSPEVNRVLGYEPDAVIGRPAADFIPARDLRKYRKSLKAFASHPGASDRGVATAIAADGAERRLEVIVKNCLDMPGVQGIVAHCTDVTARVEAQAALAASRLELEEASRMAHVGAWRWSAASNEMVMSPLMLDLLGWESQPTRTWPDLHPLYIHPDDAGPAIDALRADLRAHGAGETEHRVIRADGSIRVWAVRARAERDAKGRLLNLLGTVMDITEERQRERELIRARKLEALDLLSAGIAHDFNNLLALILGNISLARMELGEEVSPTGDKALFDAQTACHEAGRLAEQLFSFARGTTPEAFRPLDVGRLVKNTVPFLLHGTRIQADVDIAEPLPHILGDAAQMGQALQNIVLNAVAAMPEGGMLTACVSGVTVGPDEPDGDLPPGPYVAITIADTGHGIAPEHLERVFDPYFTTRQEGHGLGLATTERIVRGHGGRITVASEEGKGATFSILLPATDAVEAAATKDEPGPLRTSLVAGARVLILDDEDGLRALTTELVGKMGGRAVACTSSQEAEAFVREALAAGDPFHVAIVDLTLPGDISGIEALRRLKAADPGIRSVLCTGYAHARMVSTYNRMGFRVVLPKPFSPEDLQSALNLALSLSTRVKGRRHTDHQ